MFLEVENRSKMKGWRTRRSHHSIFCHSICSLNYYFVCIPAKVTISNYNWFSKWWDNTLHSKSVNLIRFKSCTELLFFNRAARFVHKMCKTKDIKMANKNALIWQQKKSRSHYKHLQIIRKWSDLYSLNFWTVQILLITFKLVTVCLKNHMKWRATIFAIAFLFVGVWLAHESFATNFELSIYCFILILTTIVVWLVHPRPPMHNNYCRSDNSICVFGTNKRKFRISLIPLR